MSNRIEISPASVKKALAGMHDPRATIGQRSSYMDRITEAARRYADPTTVYLCRRHMTVSFGENGCANPDGPCEVVMRWMVR